MSDADKRARKAAYDKLYREANRDKRRAQDTAYRAASKEQKALYDKQYRAGNRERIVKRQKDWRDANRDHVREKGRTSRQANAGKFAEWRKAWITANPERWAVICAARNMRRHASKLNATPAWLDKEDHDEILRIYSAARELGHHRRGHHLEHHGGDVQAGAIAFDIGDDRLVRHVERHVGVDGDLLPLGRDLDMLVHVKRSPNGRLGSIAKF